MHVTWWCGNLGTFEYLSSFTNVLRTEVSKVPNHIPELRRIIGLQAFAFYGENGEYECWMANHQWTIGPYLFTVSETSGFLRHRLIVKSGQGAGRRFPVGNTGSMGLSVHWASNTAVFVPHKTMSWMSFSFDKTKTIKVASLTASFNRHRNLVAILAEWEICPIAP